MAPDGTLPIVLQMVEPIGSLHQRWSLTDCGIGNAHTVRCGAKVDVLTQNRCGCFAMGRWDWLTLSDFCNSSNEANALPRDRLDRALLSTAIADRAPRRIDSAGQGRLGDDPPSPNAL